MSVTKLAGKSSGAPATLTSLVTSYQTAYTAAAGDVLFIVANATKASAGASALTTPSGWTVIGSGTKDNGGINCTLIWLMRVADGTSGDNPPTITVSSATWQWYTSSWGGIDHTIIPKDYTAQPDVGFTATTNTANAGEARTTSTTPGWVFSACGVRAPATFGSFAWGGGSTADLAAVGGTNNFLSTATQNVATPATVTPSGTWTGGSGTASIIISLGFVPTGATSGTQAKALVAGVETVATPKVLVANVETVATPKVFVSGSPV